jgi:hypothetical protein
MKHEMRILLVETCYAVMLRIHPCGGYYFNVMGRLACPQGAVLPGALLDESYRPD